MALGHPVQVRLSLESRLRYEAEAAAIDKPLGTYLRDRLEAEDVVLDELRMLRRAVERATAAREKEAQGISSGNEMEGITSVLLEILLTVRQMAGAKNDVAQKEVERNGYKAWSPKK